MVCVCIMLYYIHRMCVYYVMLHSSYYIIMYDYIIRNCFMLNVHTYIHTHTYIHQNLPPKISQYSIHTYIHTHTHTHTHLFDNVAHSHGSKLLRRPSGRKSTDPHAAALHLPKHHSHSSLQRIRIYWHGVKRAQQGHDFATLCVHACQVSWFCRSVCESVWAGHAGCDAWSRHQASIWCASSVAVEMFRSYPCTSWSDALTRLISRHFLRILWTLEFDCFRAFYVHHCRVALSVVHHCCRGLLYGHAFVEMRDVCLSVCSVHSYAVFLAVSVLAFVYASIFVHVRSTSVHLVVFPLAVVGLAVEENELALTVEFSKENISLIDTAVQFQHL